MNCIEPQLILVNVANIDVARVNGDVERPCIVFIDVARRRLKWWPTVITLPSLSNSAAQTWTFSRSSLASIEPVCAFRLHRQWV